MICCSHDCSLSRLKQSFLTFPSHQMRTCRKPRTGRSLMVSQKGGFRVFKMRVLTHLLLPICRVHGWMLQLRPTQHILSDWRVFTLNGAKVVWRILLPTLWTERLRHWLTMRLQISFSIFPGCKLFQKPRFCDKKLVVWSKRRAPASLTDHQG